MLWNWKLPEWPHFVYDSARIAAQERKFLLAAGSASAFLQKIEKEERTQFIVEILSLEGQDSSKIEGELLDRESLQSSIKNHFGVNAPLKKGERESGMAELLCTMYETFDQSLTHAVLWDWHAKLFRGQSHIDDLGKYRTHDEPMQIVSRRLDLPSVYFEAPPSKDVLREMEAYIEWYNGTSNEAILGKTALAHVYFESIHPFEDGNGRIGRALVEKSLSQGVGRPVLLAVSKVLEKRKKGYYLALERCNRTLEITPWVEFFADVILDAQEDSLEWLHFIIEKSTLLTKLEGEMNERQEKVLMRMFAEGPSGFQGGMSAEKYIAITKTSRATATRDLLDLVEKGAFVKTGERRHTRYWLKVGH